jgi:hypothetical protein
MTRDQIFDAWTARPFVPFRLRLPDGRALFVRHPELMSLAPDRRALFFWDSPTGGHMVDALLVSDVEFVDRRRRRRRSA